MRVTIEFDNIEINSMKATIIKEWFEELIHNKAADNFSLLRYADRCTYD